MDIADVVGIMVTMNATEQPKEQVRKTPLSPLQHAVCPRCIRINPPRLRARCGTEVPRPLPTSTGQDGAMHRCVVCVDLDERRQACEWCGASGAR